MSEARRICTRCGDVAREGARICGRCGTRVAPDAATAAPPATAFLDTIHFPGMTEGEARQTRVRPALAVLFRVAVGPSADYYAPRFLKYEKAGRGAPGWHWPSFWLPSVWAFYRKLWLEGFLFALLPVAGAFAFAALAPRIDNVPVPWLVGAALAIWLLPGDHSRAPRQFAAVSPRPADGAAGGGEFRQRGAGRRASWEGAHRFRCPRRSSWAAARCCWPPALSSRACAAPTSSTKCARRSAPRWRACARCSSRSRTAGTRLQAIPRKLDVDALRLQAAAAFFDEVSFRPANGRLRLALGLVDPGIVRPVDPAGAGGRSDAAHPVDVHPDRHSRQIPAEGMPQRLGCAGALTCATRSRAMAAGRGEALPDDSSARFPSNPAADT